MCQGPGEQPWLGTQHEPSQNLEFAPAVELNSKKLRGPPKKTFRVNVHLGSTSPNRSPDSETECPPERK